MEGLIPSSVSEIVPNAEQALNKCALTLWQRSRPQSLENTWSIPTISQFNSATSIRITKQWRGTRMSMCPLGIWGEGWGTPSYHHSGIFCPPRMVTCSVRWAFSFKNTHNISPKYKPATFWIPDEFNAVLNCISGVNQKVHLGFSTWTNPNELFGPTQCILWRRQWHPTPVLLPGKSHGPRSLIGCSLWGR